MKKSRGAHPLTPAVWAATIALAGLGVFTAGGRALHLDDWVGRIQAVGDPIRDRLFAATGQVDPFVADRANVAREVDGSFASHAATTYWHVVGGGIFLALAPFQFVRRVRKRWPALHRWSGRFLLVLGSIAAVTGVYFGVFIPYGGDPERPIVAAVGAIFLVAATRAFLAARRRDFDRHREWIIRAFAAGIGISAVRVIAVPIDLLLTPRGFSQKEIFPIVIAAGWFVTLAAAEWWLRATRRQGSVPEAAG
jgi:uncharacterized membrane protein